MQLPSGSYRIFITMVGDELLELVSLLLWLAMSGVKVFGGVEVPP